jgi:hypothetical protein
MIGAFSFRGFDGPDLRGYQTPQSSLKSALMARHALINRRMAFAASVKGECGGGSRHNPSQKLAAVMRAGSAVAGIRSSTKQILGQSL